MVKPVWIYIVNAAGDDAVWGCSDISWTICKQSAPRCRQMTTPTPHYSIFTGQVLFLTPNEQCQSTEVRYTQCWYRNRKILGRFFLHDHGKCCMLQPHLTERMQGSKERLYWAESLDEIMQILKQLGMLREVRYLLTLLQ